MFVKKIIRPFVRRSLFILTLSTIYISSSHLLADTDKNRKKASPCNVALFAYDNPWTAVASLLLPLDTIRNKPVENSFLPSEVVKALELETLSDGLYRGFAPTVKSPINIGEIEVLISGGLIRSRLATSSGVEEEIADKSVLKNMLIVQIGETIVIHTDGKRHQNYDYDNSPIFLFSNDNNGFERALAEIIMKHGPTSLPKISSIP